MANYDNFIKLILRRLRKSGFAQVNGYNKFEYLRETKKAVIMLREKGTTARVPLAKIAVAIKAVRSDPKVYDKGPSALRKYGLTHITSPIWSILHLLSIRELIK